MVNPALPLQTWSAVRSWFLLTSWLRWAWRSLSQLSTSRVILCSCSSSFFRRSRSPILKGESANDVIISQIKHFPGQPLTCAKGTYLICMYKTLLDTLVSDIFINTILMTFRHYYVKWIRQTDVTFMKLWQHKYHSPVQLPFEPCPLARSPLWQPPAVECKSLHPLRRVVIPKDYPKCGKIGILLSALVS